MIAIGHEILENGDLIKIEYYDVHGSHIVDVVWDENDPQDAEHRKFFREWAVKMVKQLGYDVPQ